MGALTTMPGGYTLEEVQGNRRLTLDAMREIGAEHFDMSWWYQERDDQDEIVEHGLNDVDFTSFDFKCDGMTACLAGTAQWAAAKTLAGHVPGTSLGIANWLGVNANTFSEVFEDVGMERPYRWSSDGTTQHAWVMEWLKRLIARDDVKLVAIALEEARDNLTCSGFISTSLPMLAGVS